MGSEIKSADRNTNVKEITEKLFICIIFFEQIIKMFNDAA